MKEIRISTNLKVGTPLTDDELKLVIGGNARYMNSCKCTKFDKDGGSSTDIMAAENESVCKEKCMNSCYGDEKCVRSTYAYTAEG